MQTPFGMVVTTVPKINRRKLLAGALGLAGSAIAARAAAAPLADMTVTSAIRGSINAEEFGVWPGALDDQSRAFAKMLAKAAESRAPVFLPPGDYRVSNIRLPRETRLVGVPGATRIVYGGDGYLFAAEDAGFIELTGLSIDGANRPLGREAQALVEMRRVANLAMDRCEILGSAGSAIALERVSGSVERSTISGAAAYALYSVEAGRMRIASNVVSDCGDGGILVHRWQPAADGSMVTGNRIERIGARSGGTGQNGNGINVFRADNVIVADNHVADCAFSAIRANSAGNVQITGNQCLRSGETAIYSEFSFEGAVIGSNVVDGAAIGISIANFNEGGRMAVCNGNIVRNLVDKAPYEAFEAVGFGIGISVEADTAVSGNVVENAPRFGMMLGWGEFLRNVTATGNVVRNAREGFAVSVVEGAGSAIVADNIVDGSERAVVGYRWADAATGDLAGGDETRFGHLRVERNLVS
ncbi:TIGR03808 family TAT-translocated repetitive protein [Neoaquamicrobium microcysteis]|nr:TIGR03808 family TAT-translocated repetitive protein [Mesorhizobium microcysteis]